MNDSEQTSGSLSIRRIRGGDGVPDSLAGAVVAIGNFDGVHRGHRTVLCHALKIAREAGRPAVALTFEPHPNTVFKPHCPVFRLTPAAMKARLLGLAGFDAVVEWPFDIAFAGLGAAAFVDDVLCGALRAGHVVTGFNFHFGHGREGGPAYLKEAGRRQGFAVTLVDAFCDENAEIVSSSRIRNFLRNGEVVEAAGLLGYRFAVEAEVIKGRQLGRTLGFPTANMALPADTELCPGIYAVRFRRPDGSLHDGVASFGHRPTVEDEGRALLETFLLDFSGNLYGERGTVSFFGFLRREEKFDGLAALVEQMRQDEAEARAMLAGVSPLTEIDRLLNF